jgi:single-strand DNA-binding protein
MAKNFNKWIFEGNLLRDPEMRYSPNGHKVTTLMVACNNAYSIGDGESAQKVEEIVVYKAAAWNTLAEISNQYVRHLTQLGIAP